MIREIEESDLSKIYDALEEAVRFHMLRDEMNSVLHKSVPRWSPLTSTLMAEKDRLADMLRKRGPGVIIGDDPNAPIAT